MSPPVTDGPQFRSSDVFYKLAAIGLGLFFVSLYIASAIILYPVVDEKLGSWFTVICFIVVMALVTNLFVPGVSLVGKLWMAGSPRIRHKREQEAARQRNQYELMSARSKQMYQGKGPPESRTGDVSPDAGRHRDAGAGRRR